MKTTVTVLANLNIDTPNSEWIPESQKLHVRLLLLHFAALNPYKYFIQCCHNRRIESKPLGYISQATSPGDVIEFLRIGLQQYCDTHIFQDISEHVHIRQGLPQRVAFRRSSRKGIQKKLSQDDRREDKVDAIDFGVDLTTLGAKVTQCLECS